MLLLKHEEVQRVLRRAAQWRHDLEQELVLFTLERPNADVAAVVSHAWKLLKAWQREDAFFSTSYRDDLKASTVEPGIMRAHALHPERENTPLCFALGTAYNFAPLDRFVNCARCLNRLNAKSPILCGDTRADSMGRHPVVQNRILRAIPWRPHTRLVPDLAAEVMRTRHNLRQHLTRLEQLRRIEYLDRGRGRRPAEVWRIG